MRRIIIPAVLLVAAISLSGCAASGSPDESSYTGAGQGVMLEPAQDSGPPLITQESAAAADGSVDRQVITSGYVTITSEEPISAATEATRIVESIGGRVDSRTEYAPIDGDKGSATLTLRLPADKLTATLEKLKTLGELREVSLSSSDVTMETQDLDARITALRASVDRLVALLATATDTDVLIKLETAISERQGNLESLESQRRYLADQVSLSTITLNLVSKADAPVVTPDSFWSGLQTGWDAFVGFFAGLLVALGVLLPWIALAGVITFLIIFFLRRRAKAVTPGE